VTHHRNPTPKQPAGPGSGFGGFLLRAAVLFVVITAGVAAGFLIASHLSRRDVSGGFDLRPVDLANRTNLSVGDTFPDISVRNQQDSALVLAPLVRGRKAILGFVSRGCEPCDELQKFLKAQDTIKMGRCRVLLLAAGVQGYEAEDFDVFLVDRPTIDELDIHIFPTVIGLDADGKITFVSSGFSRVITAPVIEKHL
jgi:hypothetical protein